MRNTSVSAYHDIKKSGTLGNLQMVVYQFVFKNGPVTRYDVKQHFGDTKDGYGNRLSELGQMGLLEIVGETINPESGHKNNSWDVTDRSKPLRIQKKPTRKELESGISQAIKIIDDAGVSLLDGKIVDWLDKWRD